MGQKKTTTVKSKADPALRSRGLQLFGAATGAYGGGGALSGLGTLPQGLSDPEMQALGGYGGLLSGELFGQQIGQYMNPYINDVIGQNTADLDRARQLANRDAASYATTAGAFGGDRAALLEAENNRNFLDSVARSSGQLRSAGFDTAARNLFQGAGMGLAGLSGLGQAQRMMPYQNYGLLAQLLGSTPGNTTNTQTQKGSPWATALGIGSIAAAPFTGGASLAGLGVANQMGGGGSQMVSSLAPTGMGGGNLFSGYGSPHPWYRGG